MKYQYLAPQAHEIQNGWRKHRVLTPDGGVICCITEADALRVIDDMNALCELICIQPNDVDDEPQHMTILLDAWQA